MSFEALGLHTSIVQAVSAAGYEKPTPVQEQAVPAGIAGRDMLVSSQTGSGKTAAFMLPALNKFANEEVIPGGRTSAQEAQAAKARGERVRFKAAQPKMLVLTPTRELALQVTSATEQYTSFMRRIRAVSILGGMPTRSRCTAGQEPGNPGRHAGPPDRPPGARHDRPVASSRSWCWTKPTACSTWASSTTSRRSSPLRPASRQTMLFSATLDGDDRQAGAPPAASDPKTHRDRSQRRQRTQHRADACTASTTATQESSARPPAARRRRSTRRRVHRHQARRRPARRPSGRRRPRGRRAARRHAARRAATACSTALRSGQLQGAGGHRRRRARHRRADASRHVINYDLPKFAEDYVHRIGRTGRAGRNGIAVLAGEPRGRHEREAHRALHQADSSRSTWSRASSRSVRHRHALAPVRAGNRVTAATGQACPAQLPEAGFRAPASKAASASKAA